jgi:hypothetical protein
VDNNVLFKVKLLNHMWNGRCGGEISYMILSKSMQDMVDHFLIAL